MNDHTILEKVEAFAARAHGEQRRKYTPEPYIVHPVRVMKICRDHTDDTCILSAALLHDVLEDTTVTKREMLSFLEKVMKPSDAARTFQLVVELTDVFVKEAYPQFNRRKRKEMETRRIIKTSPESQTIKYADIIDNCREISVHDPDFARVFLGECRTLLKTIPSGDPTLYREAKVHVQRSLEQLRTAASGR